MARFDSAIATAVRLIEKNGMTVTWVKTKSGELEDNAEPWNASDEDCYTKYYPKVCFVPVDKVHKEFISYLSERNDIVQGAVVGLMAGNVPFIVHAKDYVKRGCEVLRIRNFELIAPNEQKVLYIVEFQS